MSWDGVERRKNAVLTKEDLKRIKEEVQSSCPMSPEDIRKLKCITAMTEEEVAALKGVTGVVKELGAGNLYAGGLVFRKQLEKQTRYKNREKSL